MDRHEEPPATLLPRSTREASPAPGDVRQGHASLLDLLVRDAPTDGRQDEGRPARLLSAGFACLAVFALAFLLTARGVRAFVPFPQDLGMDVRLQAFVEHKDDYEAVYVGPSTVFRSFRPDVIDPLVGTPGEPFRSFNLGFGGMPGYEQNFYLRLIAELRPRELEWVVAEPRSFRVDRSMYNLFSEREVYWHDIETTLEVLRGAYVQCDAWSDRIELWLGHVEAFAWRATNLGLGPRIVGAMARRHLGADDVETYLLLRDGGYQSDSDHFGNAHRTRAPDHVAPPVDPRQFVSLLRLAEQPPRVPPEEADLSHVDVAGFLEQRRIVEGAGYELIYVIPPLLEPVQALRALEARGALGTLLDFSGPGRHPELYRAWERIDKQHLDATGAARFSRMVAAELAPLWAGRRGKGF